MKTVLTVTDGKVVRSMVARSLSAFACRLITAANGRDGVEAARRHGPDLVLLDATLPDGDGRQVLAALRRDATTAGIPVILLTDEEVGGDAGELAQLGAAGHVVKPFQLATLEREVSRALGSPGGAAAQGRAPAARRGGVE